MSTRASVNNLYVNEGYVLQTHRNIKAFKFLWMYFSTNPNRKVRYSFDDKSWQLTNYTTLWKIKMILQGKAFLLHS